MFEPITIPFGAKMLFNTLRLKPGVKMDDVELALGEMCSDSKELGYDLLWQGEPEGSG